MSASPRKSMFLCVFVTWAMLTASCFALPVEYGATQPLNNRYPGGIRSFSNRALTRPLSFNRMNSLFRPLRTQSGLATSSPLLQTITESSRLREQVREFGLDPFLRENISIFSETGAGLLRLPRTVNQRDVTSELGSRNALGFLAGTSRANIIKSRPQFTTASTVAVSTSGSIQVYTGAGLGVPDYVSNEGMVLTPEPATVALLGLGSLIVLRKRR